MSFGSTAVSASMTSLLNRLAAQWSGVSPSSSVACASEGSSSNKYLSTPPSLAWQAAAWASVSPALFLEYTWHGNFATFSQEIAKRP